MNSHELSAKRISAKLLSVGAAILWASLASGQQMPLKSITVTQPESAGGEPATGFITLNYAAPAGGYTIRLTSSSPSVHVPTSITIPPKALGAQFAITTSPVKANTSATLTASLVVLDVVTCSMTIEPLQVSKLTVPVDHVTGGQSGIGQITLNGHAPSSGFPVTLSSSSTAIKLPKTVTIRANSLQSSFSFGTQSVPGGLFAAIEAPTASGLAQAPVTVWGTGLAASGWAQQFGNASATSHAVAPIITVPADKWSYTAPSKITTQVSVGLDGSLYFGCQDGNLVCLHPDGTFAWKYKTGGEINSHPAVGANGLVYFGSSDGTFYALQATTGALSWVYATGESVNGSATIASDGTVYVSPSPTLTLGLSGKNGKVVFTSKNGSYRPDAILAGNGLLVMPANTYGALGAMNLNDGSIRYGIFPSFFCDTPSMSRPMIAPSGELYELAGGYDGGGLGRPIYYYAWLQGSNWTSGDLDVEGAYTTLSFNVESIAMGQKGIYSADYTFPGAGISLYGFNGKPLDRISTGLVPIQLIVTSDVGFYLIGSKIPHMSGPASGLLAFLPSGKSWSISGNYQSISVAPDSTLYVVSGPTVSALTQN